MDVARLSYEIDSSQTKTAKDNLGQMSRAAKDAERSQRGLGDTSTRAGRDVSRANNSIAISGAKGAAGLSAMGKSAGVAAVGLRGASAAAVGLTASLAPLIAPLALLASPILAISSFITGATEAEKVTAQLEAAIASTGGAAGRSVAQLQEQAAALQDLTNFGDEAINAMQGVLLTFTNIRGDVFDDTALSVLNLAERMGTDLQSAALQVGKALNDPVANLGALGRAGIQFSDSQTDLIKSLTETGRLAEAQRVILVELENQFGGSAEAARNTLGGAITSLGNTFGDLFETTGVGNRILQQSFEALGRALSDPVFAGFVNLIGQVLFAALAGLTTVVTGTIEAFNFLGRVFSSLGSSAVEAVNKILSAFGVLPEDTSRVFDTVVQSGAKAANAIVGVFVGAIGSIEAIYNTLPMILGEAFFASVNAAVQGINVLIKSASDSLDFISNKVNETFGTSIGQIGASANTIGELKNPFSGATADLGSAIRQEFSGAFDTDFIGGIFKSGNSEAANLTRTIEQTTAATKDLGAAVAGVGSGAKAANDNLQKTGQVATNSLQGARNAAGSFISDLTSGLKQGQSLWTSFGQAALNALSRISDSLINNVLDSLFQVGNAASGIGGRGGGGGLFGSLFGGVRSILGFEGGGDTPSGPRSGGVDGRGGFPAILHPNETVIDNTLPRGRAANSNNNQSQRVAVDVSVSVDNNGNLQAFVRNVSQQTVRAAAPRIQAGAVQQVGQNLGALSARNRATIG